MEDSKKLKAYVKPLQEWFRANKEREVSEGEISIAMKLKPNQMRWVLTEVRYKMPILHLADRTYLYTESNVDLLKKELEKMEAIVKQKAIKKNVLKRHLKQLEAI